MLFIKRYNKLNWKWKIKIKINFVARYSIFKKTSWVFLLENFPLSYNEFSFTKLDSLLNLLLEVTRSINSLFS